MKFGIDVDGVLRDVHENLVKVYKRIYPLHEVVPISNWYQWDISIFFPIGKELYKFFMKDCPEEIYGTAPVISGSIEMMAELYKLGKITIVTSQPSEKIENITKDWLNSERIQYDDIIFTKDKSEYKGDFLLDDCTENLKRVRAVGNSYPVALDRPWNQDWDGARVSSHKDFVDLIKKSISEF